MPLPGIVTAPAWRFPTAPAITGVSPDDGATQVVTVNGTAQPGTTSIALFRVVGAGVWPTDWTYIDGAIPNPATGAWSIPSVTLNQGDNDFYAIAFIGAWYEQHRSPWSAKFTAHYIQPGSQTFGVGTTDFEAPANNSLTVEVWAPGGGGAAVIMMSGSPSQPCTQGGDSSCAISGQTTLIAEGGHGGGDRIYHWISEGDGYWALVQSEWNGADGTASGGDVNTTGGGANGGAGADGGGAGGYGNGGHGGKGGYVKKTYYGIPAGTNLHIIVGNHGVKTYNFGGGYYNGADGSEGSAKVSWA